VIEKRVKEGVKIEKKKKKREKRKRREREERLNRSLYGYLRFSICVKLICESLERKRINLYYFFT
jgi:hypothetical protein